MHMHTYIQAEACSPWLLPILLGRSFMARQHTHARHAHTEKGDAPALRDPSGFVGPALEAVTSTRHTCTDPSDEAEAMEWLFSHLLTRTHREAHTARRARCIHTSAVGSRQAQHPHT
jgi:hypothetical protein